MSPTLGMIGVNGGGDRSAGTYPLHLTSPLPSRYLAVFAGRMYLEALFVDTTFTLFTLLQVLRRLQEVIWRTQSINVKIQRR
jgi:hypothetical protein